MQQLPSTKLRWYQPTSKTTSSTLKAIRHVTYCDHHLDCYVYKPSWCKHWNIPGELGKNYMAAVALAPCVTRSSAGLILTAYITSVSRNYNKNTLETCKNPRPTSGWSELTKSCTTSTMNFHMAYFSWIPQDNAKFKLSCKSGESKCNPC